MSKVSEPIRSTIGQTLDRAFSAVAARDRAKQALKHGDRSLSYGELDRASEALASALIQHGLRREERVTIWLESPLEFVVAMLGIVRAGGVYVPLDLRQPPERVRWIQADAGARFCVTDDERCVPVGSWGATPVLPTGHLGGAAVASTPLPRVASPMQLAYQVYTSGSTGHPKGVGVAHRSLLNTLEWSRRYFSVTPESRCANLLGWSFDASVQALWEPLLAGATLVLFDEALKQDPRALGEWIATERVLVAYVTPALLRPLVERDPGRLAGVQTFVCGGEAMRWDGFRDVPFDLFNAYGPTECAVTVLAAPVDPEGSGMPPLGRPVSGMRVQLVDDALAPSEPTGEMFLAGEGVARGYAGRPGLTADRFRPDPDDASVGLRGYRSGDLARRLADGQLVFEGRSDEQVKIRGHRVELGEVRAALEAVADVEEAAVRAVGEPDSKQLVAYVVPAQIDVTKLRAALEHVLPAHMVPTHIVLLEELPRKSSGKLDVARLPAPRQERAPERASAPPASSTEQLLCALYAEVLGVSAVGPDDDFIGLGGDSVRVMNLMWKAEQAGLALDFRKVFELEIRELAQSVDAASPAEPASSQEAPERFSLVDGLDEAGLDALLDDD